MKTFVVFGFLLAAGACDMVTPTEPLNKAALVAPTNEPFNPSSRTPPPTPPPCPVGMVCGTWTPGPTPTPNNVLPPAPCGTNGGYSLEPPFGCIWTCPCSYTKTPTPAATLTPTPTRTPTPTPCNPFSPC